MKVTLGSLAKAFEDWENNYRATPEEFLTNEEVANLGVSEVSANRASYFMALLTKE